MCSAEAEDDAEVTNVAVWAATASVVAAARRVNR